MGPKKKSPTGNTRGTVVGIITSEMVTVTSADHHKTMVQGLWDFWRAKRGVDLYFQWGGISFGAHQILVDIFLSQEKLWQIGGNETASDQGALINSLLEFLYNGTVRIGKCQVDQLLDVAQQLDFTMLVKALKRIKMGQIPNCICSHLSDHGNSSCGGTTTGRKSVSFTKNVKSTAAESKRKASAAAADHHRDSVESSDADVGNSSSQVPRKRTRRVAAEGEAVEAAARKMTRRSNNSEHVSSELTETGDGSDVGTTNRVVTRKSSLQRSKNLASKSKRRDVETSSEDSSEDDDEEEEEEDTNSDEEEDSDSDDTESDNNAQDDNDSSGETEKKSKRVPAATTTNFETRPKKVVLNKDGLSEDKSKRLERLAKKLPLPQDVFTSLPMLECPECDFKTTEFLSHINHINTAHKVDTIPAVISEEEQLRCRICDRMFTIAFQLREHFTEVHPGEKMYKCPTCDVKFNHMSHLNKHAESHGRTLDCQLCGKIFRTNYKLGIHMRRHRGEKLFMCHFCGKGLSTANSLTMHYRVHTGEKPYVCEACGKSFADRTTLKRHLVMHEPNSPRHACQICNRLFKRPDALRVHINQKHTEGYVKKVQRRKPGKAGAEGETGNPPRRNWHTDRRMFTCRLCQNPPVQGYRTEMERHQKKEHPGQKIFGCDQCEFATSCVSFLPVHARSHTGERPYKCEECGKAFRDQSNYRHHVKFHSRGEKRFRCLTCGHRFHLRGHLKDHLKKVHKMAPDDAEAVLNRSLAFPLEPPAREAETAPQAESGGEGSDDESDSQEEDYPATQDPNLHVRGVLDFADPNLVYFNVPP